MRPPSPAVVRMRIAEAAQSESETMAEVRMLKVKKIYPFVIGEEKKKNKKNKDDALTEKSDTAKEAEEKIEK